MLLRGNSRLRYHFHERTVREFQESRKIVVRRPAASIGDIGRDRNGSATHLVRQSKSFVTWKGSSYGIDRVGMAHGSLPYIKLLESKHSCSPHRNDFIPNTSTRFWLSTLDSQLLT